jgi:hypothetical protein
LSAEVTIDRLATGQVRIAMREGWGGIAWFVLFVVCVAVALFALMPQARAQPGWLIGVVAAALAWAGIARHGREEYLVDRQTRSVTARRSGLLDRREDQVSGQEISAVRLARSGPDDDRLVVELLANQRVVRLRLPRRINTLTASDQASIGRLLAEHLDVPLQT